MNNGLLLKNGRIQEEIKFHENIMLKKKNNAEIGKLFSISYLKFWDSKSNGQVAKCVGALMLEMGAISNIEKSWYHSQTQYMARGFKWFCWEWKSEKREHKREREKSW